MVKYKYYIFITIALLAVAIILLLKDKNSTLKVDNKIFAVSDTSEITKISIHEGDHKLVLERSGLNWQINNGYYAKPRAIKGLLQLLSNLEINSPVPKSFKKDVLASFNRKSISVVIESSDKMLKSFRISENDSLKLGSFMMLQDDEEPYIVRITGFDGHLSMLFPSQTKVWRDKAIFRYRPGDILSIDVTYQANPKASFVYSFFGPNDIQIVSKNLNKSVKINRETAKNYLAGFASVSFVEQLDNHAKNLLDSLNQQHPYCEINVKNIENKISILKTYRIPLAGQNGKFNPDKMYAVIQKDTVPVLIKYIDFDPIMKEYNDFVTQ